MINSKLLPCCSTCHTVKGEGKWYTKTGSLAKTTDKLQACARCHLTLYCGQACQAKDWKNHKVTCKEQNETSASEVEKIIQKCQPQTGKAELNNEGTLQFVQGEFVEGKLLVSVQSAGYITYLFCNRIFNSLAHIEWAQELKKKGYYQEAFQVMAMPHVYSSFNKCFFDDTVIEMHKKGIAKDAILSCAKLLNKTATEVEVAISPPQQAVLPNDLQERIEAAKKSENGARDVQMEGLAEEVAKLGEFDYAFDLIYNWATFMSTRTIFFRSVVDLMIKKGIPHEKLMQLAKKIQLNDDQILTEITPAYALNNQVSFACQLAKQSKKSDYYLEIIFSAFLNEKRMEEAKAIFQLVSREKQRDLQFYLQN